MTLSTSRSTLRRLLPQAGGAALLACLLLLGFAPGAGTARAGETAPAPAPAPAPGAETDGDSAGEAAAAGFLDLGLEDLMNMTVTSVSRKSQLVSDAAAAVFVITQDDIRRSGVTSIAEALRMVPGLEVARIDANKWAISSRGFNSRFASKMLVLFDGRTVYTPLFSGVFWDRQDTMLEDIDRIEVIRGPGAALWGANAVNGVINIITRQAGDTLGTRVTAGGGTQERAFGALRYGRQLGEDSALRLYGKYTNRSGLDDTSGREAYNGWSAVRGGFRLDADPSAQNSLTLQGDVFKERVHETYVEMIPAPGGFNNNTPVFGANLLSRWKHSFSETADMELQLYYDRTDTTMGVLAELRDTYDIDFQNRFALSEGQEIVWGGGYRYWHDRLGFPTSGLVLTPASQGNQQLSSFLQDNITLVPEQLHFILGSKFEVNSYTGFEAQPNARLIWTPNKRHTVWGAISRAVRTPSRGEESFSLQQPSPMPGVVLNLLGNDNLKAEDLIAYELGYRIEPVSGVSADLATFYNSYSKLVVPRAGALQLPPAVPQPVLPLTMGNFGRADTCGVELALDYKALSWWRLRGAYTYFRLLHTETDPGASFALLGGDSPHHQVSLRSSQDLTRNVELDLWLRYVSGLQLQDTATTQTVPISGYVTLDTRLAWQPWGGVELSLVGQNLLQSAHREFVPQEITTQATQVGRSMYGKLDWHF